MLIPMSRGNAVVVATSPLATWLHAPSATNAQIKKGLNTYQGMHFPSRAFCTSGEGKDVCSVDGDSHSILGAREKFSKRQKPKLRDAGRGFHRDPSRSGARS